MVRIDPHEHGAALFDLDGVLTDTASVHRAAWKRLFDQYLAGRGERPGPFTEEDYLRHVDGRPRDDGVRAFLGSRGIDLPAGSPSDPPGHETLVGLGKLKDRYFRDAVGAHGARVLDGAVELVTSLRARRVRTAVVSASRNCALVLDGAGIAGLFDVSVDGVVAAELGLRGKPDPATYLEAARRLGCAPRRSAVLEDAAVGVRAGRAGGFGLVIGVATAADPGSLRDSGADVVVRSLREVAVDGASPCER
ncbi:HAD family phosphatase [Saccharopolyspora sp. 6V]|uniref:HAD family hydrolase n=1 Tax=Saccharopolyspora sp. 6V TaxID=2877239 RepID=UPI001CD6CB49|nr:HAD-IA family hydrolase [Saccharopolyspora sp. 6V]MCA1194133.1 HAD-IA family hydrolase [Saccharopolyspora sp. 6V]